MPRIPIREITGDSEIAAPKEEITSLLKM